MTRVLPFALLFAVLVAACSRDRGVVYPVAPERAREILTRTDLPPVFGSDPPSSEVRSSRPSEVTWIVSRNGHELMRYVATLSAAGEGKTRVELELKGVKTGPAGDVEQRLAENKSIKNLYLVAMREQIASAIEGRPLDLTPIWPALAAATLANMGMIRRSFDDAARASEELERAQSGIKRRGG